MEVNFAFLCDYADQSGGKMGALGIGFDTIYAAKVPAMHPVFFAVISIRFRARDGGPKQVSMHLIDEDGKDVVPPLEATINVCSPASGFLYRNQQIAMAMHGVTFPRYGDYAVSWLVGGQEIKVIPFKVAQPPVPLTTA